MREVSPSPQLSLTIHPAEFQFIAIFCSMFKQPQMFPIHNLVPLEEYSHLQQTVFKDGHSNPSPLPLQSHFSEVANGHSQTIKQKWIWTGLGHFLKAEFGCINLCLYIVQLWKRSHNYGPASVSFNLPSVSSGREKKEVPLFPIFFFLAALCGMWDPSSPTRDQTQKPDIGSVELNHQTAREVPCCIYFEQVLPLSVHIQQSCQCLPALHPSC